MKKKYINLEDLAVYRLAREVSQESWKTYQKLNWRTKKTIGDQFIRSIDSIGANIAEGYGRYHYLDKIKFYYNARGSLYESRHWLGLLEERKLITQKCADSLLKKLNNLGFKLNSFISSTFNAKNEPS